MDIINGNKMNMSIQDIMRMENFMGKDYINGEIENIIRENMLMV